MIQTDPDRSWITDPNSDHPKGMHPKNLNFLASNTYFSSLYWYEFSLTKCRKYWEEGRILQKFLEWKAVDQMAWFNRFLRWWDIKRNFHQSEYSTIQYNTIIDCSSIQQVTINRNATETILWLRRIIFKFFIRLSIVSTVRFVFHAKTNICAERIMRLFPIALLC